MEVELVVGCAETVEQVEGLVKHPARARAGAVDLVDHQDHGQAGRQRLAEHEAGLGQRALAGVGQAEAAVDLILARAADGVVQEVVLATNFTVEGEATAHYAGELLRAKGIRVTRIARGLPVGGELDYLDEGTLAQALRARRPVG